MIPHCKQNGCQVAKSGRPPCAKGCALEKDEPAPRKPRPVAPPKIEQAPPKPIPEPPLKPLSEAPPKTHRKPVTGPRVHLSTGIFITRKTISQWRPKPPGPEPWEKGACGVITSTATSTDIKRVTCQTCLRTATKT